ncbi:MAG: hypothetical protein ACKVQB_08965 [Bacteroidia bacterium]
MNKKLVNYMEMSKEEQIAIDSAIKFTGSFINHIVTIEQSIERIIGYFLCYHKAGNENIGIFLNHYLFTRIDFSVKVAHLDQILKIDLKENHKFDKLNQLLTKFLELRNIVAHYPFIANPNELHYIKPDFDFKKVEDSPNEGRPKDWWYFYREIKIPDTKGIEIVEQVMLLRGILDILEIIFEGNLEKIDKKAPDELINELLTERAVKLMTRAEKLGVFGINLKE